MDTFWYMDENNKKIIVRPANNEYTYLTGLYNPDQFKTYNEFYRMLLMRGGESYEKEELVRREELESEEKG